MTHYLRDFSSNTIVDVEATKDDINCVVVIRAYSEMLLSLPEHERESFILDMNTIQEIRATYWEGINPRNTDPDKFAAENLKEMAQKWGLFYVTD